MDTLLQDVKYAARTLKRSPGFSAIAVLILALGIGANATIFSVVNAVLLRPPAEVREPERMVALYTSDFSGPRFSASSYPDFRDFRDRTQVFEGVLAHTIRPFSLSDGRSSERGVGVIATANYFSLLGVQAVLGRGFLPSEDQPGTAPVAVISHSFWRRHYAGDSAVVGNVLRVGGRPFTVVGVAPEGFEGLVRGLLPDFWMPLGAPMFAGEDVAARLERRGNRGLFLAARLKPGSTEADARAALAGVASQLFQDFPGQWTDVQDRPRVVSVLPLQESLVFPRMRGAIKSFMALLMVVVGLVLMIACANVANLLLARSAARQKEIAIRMSLGAGRSQVVRQLLTESLLLGVAAGAAGLALAVWAGGLLSGFQPPVPVPIGLLLTLDWRVVGFTALVALLTAVTFGLAPALQLTRGAGGWALRDALAAGGSPARHRLGNALVIVQMAMSLVLLVGGGLLIRALQSGQDIAPGFDAERGVMMGMDLDLQGYDEDRGRNFIRALLDGARQLGGVEAVALGTQVPLNPFGGERRGIAIEGYERRQGEDLEFDDNFVTPDYFRTLGITVVAGRPFAESDDARAPGVVMVNETFARRFWPGQNPLGKRLSTSGAEGPWLDVVGVVEDGKYSSLAEEAKPYFLRPLAQDYRGGLVLFARAAGDPESLLQPLRSLISSLDADLPVYDVRTLRAHVAISLLPQRIAATLLGAFGALALLLASMGVYSVMAFSVSRRTREIGIRVALGAARRDVSGMVLRQGMLLAAVGGSAGIIVAIGVSHLIRGLLYGVSAQDPLSFVAGALVLGIAAFFACWLPARRAAGVDPIVALRSE